MSIALFEPKSDRPEWRIIYEDILSGLDYDSLVTYEQLDQTLGRDFRSARNPLYKAAGELLALENKALAAVVGRGYRIVQPPEQAGLAKGRHKRARRQMRGALGLVTNVDRSGFTPEQRANFERLELGYRRMTLALRRIEAKQQAQQQALDAHSAEIDQLRSVRDHVSRLEEQLRQRGYIDKEEAKT